MASKVVPENKREEALVALGRKEAAQRQAHKAHAEALKEAKREAAKAKREAKEEAAEAEPMHRIAAGGGFALGTGAGLAAQHFGMDQTAIQSAAVKKGTVPALGLLLAGGGLLLDGGAGDFLFCLGLGTSVGSGLTSAAKYLSK